MKSSKRWTYLRSQMLTSKGFWHFSESPKSSIIYKLDKQTDSLQRRFFLRPLKCAETNQYYSHAKKLSLIETKKKTPEALWLKTDGFILNPITEEPILERNKESFLLIQEPLVEFSSSDHKSSETPGFFSNSPSNFPGYSKSPKSLLELKSNKNSENQEIEFEISADLMKEKNEFCGDLLNRTRTDPIILNKKPIIQRSNTKSDSSGGLNSMKSLSFSSKRRRKTVRGPFKKHRDLRFSIKELNRFSNKEIEDLGLETNDNGKKSNNIQYFAEKITMKGAYYGLIELTREDFIFRSLDSERPDDGPTKDPNAIEPHEGDPLYIYFALGAKNNNFLKTPIKKQWNLSEISSVQGRSYNLRLCAIELFTNENKGHFFNVYDPKIAEEIVTRLLKVTKNKNEFFYNREEAFKASEIQQKWIKGQISNFEYIMLLNKYAGRTYNDIHQYPVFPWVLRDYSSPDLDLSNPEVFRDLGLPIGALNPSRLKIFRDNYKTLSQIPDGNIYTQPFLYGTHYSGIGPVLHFLIRIEPFSTQHTLLQSGSFDCPDRLFSSIPQTWKSCLDRDLKELTPEFYYLPDFLLNKNEFDFGEGQNGDIIGSVALPRWASNPYEFVFKHRQALESEYVSKNLHKWIDLIFGSKQTGKAAKDADNVFGFLTYEGNVNLLEINDINERRGVFEQIAEYGQTPHQILLSDHPQKEIFKFDKSQLLKENDLNKRNIENYQEINFSVQKLAFSNNFRDIAVYYNNNSVVFMPVEEVNFSYEFQCSKRHIIFEKRKSFQIPNKIAQNEHTPGSQIYFFKGKKRVFLLGGLYDCSLKVFSKGKEIHQNEDFLHRKPISCISVCEECKIIACGSKDCRISLWRYDKDMVLSPFSECGGLIYGHNNEITLLKIDEILDILISIDRDGVVLVHEIRKGRFMKKIQVELEREEVVNNLDVHENGLILIGTNENRFLIYSLNGDFINEIRIKNEMKMRYRTLGAKFVSKWSSYFAVGNSEGDLMIYNAFHQEVIYKLSRIFIVFFHL